MLAPLWFFGFDSLMEFIAFAIASAVAYQALKGYRLSKERTLLYLNLSFGLLGAGLLIDGLANLLVLLARSTRAFIFLPAFGYTINFLAQLVAYGLLVFVHATRKECWWTGDGGGCGTRPLLRTQRRNRTHPNLPPRLHSHPYRNQLQVE